MKTVREETARIRADAYDGKEVSDICHVEDDYDSIYRIILPTGDLSLSPREVLTREALEGFAAIEGTVNDNGFMFLKVTYTFRPFQLTGIKKLEYIGRSQPDEWDKQSAAEKLLSRTFHEKACERVAIAQQKADIVHKTSLALTRLEELVPALKLTEGWNDFVMVFVDRFTAMEKIILKSQKNGKKRV